MREEPDRPEGVQWAVRAGRHAPAVWAELTPLTRFRTARPAAGPGPLPEGTVVFSVLRIRDYRFLASGQLLSSLGDWFLLLAVPYYVLELTGSARASGFSLAAGTVPALVLGPLAGALVDRWNRLRVMIAADLARMAAVSLMLWVDSPDEVWLIYVALVLESSLSQLFNPASAALLPQLVGREGDLHSANSLSALIAGSIRLVGGPLGGAVYGGLGFTAVVAIDTISYACSALCLAMVRHRPSTIARHSTGEGRGQVRTLVAEIHEGVAQIRHSPWLAAIAGAGALFAIATSAVNVGLIPYMDRVLHASPQVLGLLFGAFGAGSLLGVPLSRALARRLTDRTVLVGSLTALAMAFAATFNTPVIGWSAVLFLTIGAPMVCFAITSGTFVARHTPDAVLGRVSATIGFLQAAASLAGMLAGSLLSEALGVVTTMNLCCVTVALAAGTMLLMPRRQSPIAEDVPFKEAA
ncbi:MFS transporter [Streptomyces sp. NPDC001536]|uniref:MFS transporter n=1 Tax=Streptomyces sp. NPDC001536 TaxID=3364583 RepID=UPI0036A6F4C2